MGGGSVEGERELNGEYMLEEEEDNHTAAPPSDPMQDMLIDLDIETSENLFFSVDEDDAFPSLADFPACLSSPMQPPPPTSSCEEPLDNIWEERSSGEEKTGFLYAFPSQSSSFSTEEKTGFLCGGGDGGNDDCSSEDLANVFLDWLKRNKESISPEDLRSIKLKRSTIECAARRLGGGKQGRIQLLKLILAWVQNHHLCQKRKRRPSRAISETSIYIGRRDDDEEELIYNNTSSSLHPFPQELAVPCNSNYWMPYNYTSAGCFQAPPNNYNYYYNINEQANFSADHQPPWQQAAGNLSPAAATKEARKKRMARHRRSSSSLHHHHRNPKQHNHSSDTLIFRVLGDQEITSSAYHDSNNDVDNSSNCPFSLSSLPAPNIIPSLSPEGVDTPSSATMAQMQQENNLHRHALSAGLDHRRFEGLKTEKSYKFLLQKVLKQSDVGNLGRIVLPKKEAEINLPELDARDGISIEMEDIGTSRVWNMRYRFWPNNKSRMYLLENTGDFVRSNGLQEGDFIVIYSDIKCGKYMIRGVKVRQPVEMIKGTSNHNSRKADHQKKEKNNSTMAVDDKGKSPYALGS